MMPEVLRYLALTSSQRVERRSQYLSLRFSNPFAKLIGKSKEWAHYRIWLGKDAEA